MQRSWWVGRISMMIKMILWSSLLGIVGSCGKKPESDLVIKLIPPESLVLEMDVFSCGQILDGTKTDTGTVTPKYKGPVVQFNRMSMEWKRSTKLLIHQAKIKFSGSGIQGGEASCELTSSLTEFFESPEAIAVRVPATAPSDPRKDDDEELQELKNNLYSASTFFAPGTIITNPRCRVACSIPLADSERPEITASGEITVKASELTNEGKDDEKYFRVKSTFRIRVVP